MLFSGGDSPQNASSILSGEGFDEVQPGESPVSRFCSIPLPTSLKFSGGTGIKAPQTTPVIARPNDNASVCSLATEIRGRSSP